MSICPKNKSSKGRRNRRRANWKMTAPTLVKCSKCGALMMPHRVCKAADLTIKRKLFQHTLNNGKSKKNAIRLDFLRRFRRMAFPILKEKENRSYGEISQSCC